MVKNSLFKNTFSSLYHPNFRYFWFGQAISTIGTMIQITALSWYVYKISGSPFLLGLMGVFEFGPVLVLSLFVGVFNERFPKKNILLFTQSIFLIQSLLLALLVWQQSTNYWLFAMLALVAGIGNSIDQPTRQSYFVELVGKKDLPNAISLNSTTFNLARIIGPAIAGLIMKYLGTAECFLINGLSFIPVIYGITLITVVGKPRARNRESKVLHEIGQGLRYAFTNSTILPTFIVMFVVCIFAMNASVVLPIFAKDVLLGTETTYSIMMSTLGLGSLFGALFMAGIGSRLRTKNFLVLTAVIMGTAEMLTLVPVPAAHQLKLIVPLLVIIGFCNLCFLNRANSRIQLNTDDAYRSRVMSIYVLVVTGSSPLGNLFTGWAITHTAEKYGFFIGGIITVVLVLIIFAVYKKQLHKAKVVKE